MRILILANNSGGLYCFREMLMRKLREMGNEVYASTPFDDMVEELKIVSDKLIETPVDRRGINPKTDIKLLREYIRLIKEEKPDKVITYTIKPNIYGGIACRLAKVPMYANITGLGTAFQGNGMLTKLVTAMYKFAFKKVKSVFFENEENRDIIVNKGIVPKEKTYCLHGAGVDLEKFTFTEYPPDGTVHFLFIGRVMREKGMDELFEAAKRLKSENRNITVDIIGGFEDDYADAVKQLEKDGTIKYYGYQQDVRMFIKRSHCFVLPSWHEGMANTLLECGAMGRPLITSNIHGCLEAVQDGKTGYLCNVRDAGNLYEKMKRFVDLPYEKKKEMGRLSHEFVASVFDKRKVVEETVGVIMK